MYVNVIIQSLKQKTKLLTTVNTICMKNNIPQTHILSLSLSLSLSLTYTHARMHTHACTQTHTCMGTHSVLRKKVPKSTHRRPYQDQVFIALAKSK